MLVVKHLGSLQTIRDQVTATEVINGIEHRIILEQDERGTYRETRSEPCPERPSHNLHLTPFS